MTSRARGALVWRLYAVGIVQLVLVIAGALALALVLMRPPHWFDPQGVSARLAPLIGKPGQLERALNELRNHEVQVSLYDADRALIASNVKPPLPVLGWSADRMPLAPKELPPPPPFAALFPGMGPHGHGLHGHGLPGPAPHGAAPGSPHDADSPADESSRPWLFAHPHGGPPLAYARLILPAGDGLLVTRFALPRPSPLPPLLALGFGLVVIFVGAFLTARWIGRPIEQLTRTARALGGGDLRARSAIARNDELGELGRTFDDMAARMEQLLLAEKELLANVAHELRTPLARIRVALEIAVEGDSDAVRASLAEIAVDLSELESLIDDVLTAARFEIAGGRAEGPGFALHRERIPPRLLFERAVERFSAHHPQRALELECASELPEIEVDPVLFRRVLDNLLENAHKYSPEPSPPIRLQLNREGGHAVFSVIDRGMGIAEADLPRVFGAFFRAERSRSRGGGGVGLGLTLAKRIVDAHGGTITVQSTLGSGTTVRVSVPLVG